VATGGRTIVSDFCSICLVSERKCRCLLLLPIDLSVGFGGLDHVEAFESNDVNVLVVDTEMYSNTGGQQSKATPAGATQAFARGGKVQKKKSLGEIFMTYEHVYVASVALSNQAQTLQAFVEAEQYNGPSIIIAYR
jgi:pyruvate-ferredoxin/flavodoxin oxidoreductase